jgi:hypothetical protein
VLLVSVLVGLATIGGLILFIIPGIYIGVRLAVSIEALVVEGRRGTQAMGRSWELVGTIGGAERAQIQLVDHVQHEPGQMIGWKPVSHVRWKQKRLVTVTGKEVEDYGRSYAISVDCLPRRTRRSTGATRLDA